ncbi:MAG: CAP domain-containing protein [Bacteroidota bacterium]|nr:CAP domain-containing protein [Bacteroidota bacterium]
MFHVKPLLFFFLVLPLGLYAQRIGTTTLETKALPKQPEIINSIEAYVNDFPELDARQREWFYWTNYSRSDPRRFWDSAIAPLIKVYPQLSNSYTKSLKDDLYKSSILPMVKSNRDLAKIAQAHSSSLAVKNEGPSHTSPVGVTFEARMKSINIKRCGGENISFGPPNTLLMLVLLYIDEGVPDLGHRKSLLNSSFLEMGIGVSAYPDNKFMIVQDFACDQR